MNEELKKHFHAEMLNVYERVKSECGYVAQRLRQSIESRGGVGAAKNLLAETQPSEGFRRLRECGCLCISVECLVLSPKFRTLFTDLDLTNAENRLRNYDFDPADCKK